MVITRSLIQAEKDEIINHIEVTAWSLVKWYTLKQLSILDWIDTRTVKTSWKYIPVRIDLRENKHKYLKGQYRKPYTIKRIRVDEIKYIFDKRNKKTKLVETFK